MEPTKRRSSINLRAWLDYAMALLMVLLGVFIVFPEKIVGFNFFEDSLLVQGAMKWVIGGLFALYGLFRAYRGYLISKQAQDE